MQNSPDFDTSWLENALKTAASAAEELNIALNSLTSSILSMPLTGGNHDSIANYLSEILSELKEIRGIGKQGSWLSDASSATFGTIAGGSVIEGARFLITKYGLRAVARGSGIVGVVLSALDLLLFL